MIALRLRSRHEVPGAHKRSACRGLDGLVELLDAGREINSGHANFNKAGHGLVGEDIDNFSHASPMCCELVLPQSLIHFTHQLLGRHAPERGVVHNAVEDFFIAIHAVDEKPFEHPVEDVFEVFHRVDSGSRF